jgi:hypothetical protein
MKKTIVLIIALLLSQYFHAQFAMNNIELKLKEAPNTEHTIIQRHNGTIKKIAEYDAKGRLIFDYRESSFPYFNWKEPHRFIYAKEYDDQGRLIKRYDFNSNAGLSIYLYEYVGNSRTRYRLEHPEDGKKINTNPFAYINYIQSYSDLLASKEVATILKAPKEFINRETFNEENQLIRESKYNERRKDSLITHYRYDGQGNEIYKSVLFQNANEIDRETLTRRQNENTTESVIIGYRDGQKSYSYLFASVNDTIQNTVTNYSKYGGALNIRQKFFDADSLVTDIYVYETSFSGTLIVPVSEELKKTAHMRYQYNKEGLLMKEEMNNYKTGKSDTREYTYQIE